MNKPRLLIVEDETIVAADLAIHLDQLGYQVVGTAASGEQALALAEDLRPDLVLTDIRLKGAMDGIDLAREVRVRLRLPVVFLTAYAEEATLERAKVTEPFGYILKPFESRELETAIEMALYKHQAERKLQESEWRFHSLVGNVPNIAVQGYDRNRRVLFWNSASEALYGFTREEALGRQLEELVIPPPMCGEVIRLVENWMTNGVPIPAGELVLQKKDGQPVIVFSSHVRLVNGQGESEMFCIDVDLTAHKQAEAALQASEAKHAKMVANIGDVIVIIDSAGINRYKSPNIEKWFGWRPEEVVGRKALENVHPEDVAAAQQFIGALLREPRAAGTTQCRYQCKDGGYKWIEFTGVNLVHDPDINGILGNYHDITKRIDLEEQLRQAQKLESVGQLAGGVAHDFNNILASLMMNVSFLQQDPHLDPETQETLKQLMVDTRRAATLTRQLLLFSRRSVMEVKVLDLNELLTNLLAMLGRLIGERITVRFERRESLPRVEADAGMLEQVLMNLAVNARDAMPRGGVLTFRIESLQVKAERIKGNPEVRPGPFICLSVIDTGCGMDGATLKRIFEPFFTTKEVGKGTGLGLATAYGIVAQHRGWMEVQSELGQGTTFKVFLPATVRVMGMPGQEGKVAPVRGHETILLVEDEASVRQMVARGLRRLGYRVLEAANGQAALGVWQQNNGHIDLLFSDMIMPGELTGLDLAGKLRAEKPGLKVIMSSGYTAELTEPAKLTAADIVFLQKPYHIQGLSQIVRNCLDRT
jgi:PAS domain S-box-containing protein